MVSASYGFCGVKLNSKQYIHMSLILIINTKRKQRDLIPGFRNLENNEGDKHISSNGHNINAQWQTTVSELSGNSSNPAD